MTEDYRIAKCIFCGNEQDYICEVHYEVIKNYTLSDAKLSLAVIGDVTLRSELEDEDMISVISCHAKPIDLVNYIRYELSDLTGDDDHPYYDFRYLVLITPKAVDSFTSDDFIHLLSLNYTMSPIALVFETQESSNKFFELYNTWNPPTNFPLPIFAYQSNWVNILEILTEAKIPNRFINVKVVSS